MAFSYTIDSHHNCGDLHMVFGTFNADGVTSGDINTGLSKCLSMILTPKTSAAATQCAVNETLPCTGSAVTIDVASGTVGYWEAKGYL